MDINFIELKQIVDRLFTHIIETRGMENCKFDEDYYWNIPDSELYQMYDKPKEIDIGSLCDDWELLFRLLDLEEQPLAYQFTQLASIFRYLGDHLRKELAQYGG